MRSSIIISLLGRLGSMVLSTLARRRRSTAFSLSFDFLTVLLNTRVSVPGEEVAGAALRQMSLAQKDPRRFLVAAGKELAVILGGDLDRLRTVLGED